MLNSAGYSVCLHTSGMPRWMHAAATTVRNQHAPMQIDIHCERSDWEDTGVAIAKALGLQVGAL